MHHIYKLLSFIFGFISFVTLNAQQTVNIAIVSDGQDRGIEEFETTMKKEIMDLLSKKYTVNFLQEYGHYDYQKIEKIYKEFQSQPAIDYILATGLIGSSIVMQEAVFNHPTHASFVVDAELTGAPKKGNASGIRNLSYTETPTDPEGDVRVFQKVYDYKKLGIVIPNISPEYNVAFKLFFDEIMKAINKPFEFINIENAEEELDNTNADAIYFTAFGQLTDEQIGAVIKKVNEKKLPSFALFGRGVVEAGVLAGNAPENTFDIQARRIALNILKSLDGRDPGTFNVEIPSDENDFVINMLTAAEIDYYPNFDVLSEADLLNIDNQFTDKTYTLRGAIIEALQENLDIKIANYDVTLADLDIKTARSNYLPQGTLSLTGTGVDKKIHENLLAGKAPFNMTGDFQVSQAILSVDAISNIIISKLTKELQEHTYEQRELDVIYETALAYLNILLAKSNVRVQNENVSVTRTNLNISGKKVKAGYSGQADELRWESQFATNKISLNDALAQLEQSRYNLNRYLNNEIDEPFRTAEVSLADNILMVSDGEITKWINDPNSLYKFSNFLVEEAFVNLPELKQIESALKVQEKALKWQKAAFGTPTIAGFFNLQHSFLNTGSSTLQDGVVIDNSVLYDFDRPYWNGGFQMSLPISTGGARFTQRQNIMINIEKLKDQQENTRKLLELQIRSNLEDVSAAYNRMLLSEEATIAAKKSLEIAQDSYKQGLLTVSDLIEVQNATLQTEQLKASALYQFYQSFLAVERSIGFFYSMTTEKEKQDFRNRLSNYMLTK